MPRNKKDLLPHGEWFTLNTAVALSVVQRMGLEMRAGDVRMDDAVALINAAAAAGAFMAPRSKPRWRVTARTYELEGEDVQLTVSSRSRARVLHHTPARRSRRVGRTWVEWEHLIGWRHWDTGMEAADWLSIAERAVTHLNVSLAPHQDEPLFDPVTGRAPWELEPTV
jgi:hypothetical protein